MKNSQVSYLIFFLYQLTLKEILLLPFLLCLALILLWDTIQQSSFMKHELSQRSSALLSGCLAMGYLGFVYFFNV